jgi:hypothetical protein
MGGWKDESNRQSLSDAPYNYAVYPEGDLVFIDIDDRENAPEKVLTNTQGTFTVESPHGEHRWIRLPDDIPNIKREWGELRTDNQYVVGPGSRLTDCEDGCCTPENPGEYQVKNDREIQRVSKDDLEEWIGGFEKETDTEPTPSPNGEPLPEPDRDDIKIANHALSELQSDCTPFFKCLMDRLNGGRGDMVDSLTKEGGRIDRSRQDFITIEHLYGVFRHYGYEEQRAKELARAKYSEHVRENPFTKDGQSRKWKDRGREYRRMILRNAIRQFDESQFKKLMNKESNSRRHFNKYSELTYAHINFGLEILIYDWDIELAHGNASIYNLEYSREEIESAVTTTHMYQDIPPSPMGESECRFPTPKSVRELCSALDRNGEGTYKEALKRMRRNGEIKLACLEEGVDYRVYPFDLEDPKNAEWVKGGGERYEPMDKAKSERAIA